MEHKFWIDRWEKGETGFHQPEVHELLRETWPRVGAPQNSAVFVPLCGKSQDMVWLADAGHRIIGSELSPIAIDDFFAAQNLSPQRASGPAGLTKVSAGAFELWQGDVFKLQQSLLEPVKAIYDRAALVAFPSDLRKAYAHHLLAITPPGAPILLISLSFDQSEMDGPPFSVSQGEVETLFGDSARMDVLARRDGLKSSQNLKKRGLTALEETAYLIHRA